MFLHTFNWKLNFQLPFHFHSITFLGKSTKVPQPPHIHLCPGIRASFGNTPSLCTCVETLKHKMCIISNQSRNPTLLGLVAYFVSYSTQKSFFLIFFSFDPLYWADIFSHHLLWPIFLYTMHTVIQLQRLWIILFYFILFYTQHIAHSSNTQYHGMDVPILK